MTHLEYQANAIGSFVGRCARVQQNGEARIVMVIPPNEDDALDVLEADCLDHVHPSSGDRLLVVHPDTACRPVVVGTIGAADGLQIRMSNGNTVCAVGQTLQLRGPDGRVALEISTAGGAPIIRVSDGGVPLELSGTLAIRARQIRLEAEEELMLVGGTLQAKGQHGAKLCSAGPIEVEAEGDLRLNGDRMFINCDADFGRTPQM